MTHTDRGYYPIKINGEEINLLFSMNFWRLLDKKGYQLETIAEHLDGSKGVIKMLDTLSNIVQAGGEAYQAKYKVEFPYTIDEITEWFSEDIDQDVLQGIFEAIMDSTKIFGKKLSDGQRKPGKKKLQ